MINLNAADLGLTRKDILAITEALGLDPKVTGQITIEPNAITVVEWDSAARATFERVWGLSE